MTMYSELEKYGKEMVVLFKALPLPSTNGNVVNHKTLQSGLLISKARFKCGNLKYSYKHCAWAIYSVRNIRQSRTICKHTDWNVTVQCHNTRHTIMKYLQN